MREGVRDGTPSNASLVLARLSQSRLLASLTIALRVSKQGARSRFALFELDL